MPASTLSKVDPNSPIAIARLMTLKQAVRLEATGLKHSSGKSMRVVACAELGLKRTTKADDVIGALAREIEKRQKLAAQAARAEFPEDQIDGQPLKQLGDDE